jgi:hypothetical protein
VVRQVLDVHHTTLPKTQMTTPQPPHRSDRKRNFSSSLGLPRTRRASRRARFSGVLSSPRAARGARAE